MRGAALYALVLGTLFFSGCAAADFLFGRRAPVDAKGIHPGPDGVEGTSDDAYIVDVGPDGEPGTEDDVTSPGLSRAEDLSSTFGPIATGLGYPQLALGLGTVAYLLTTGYAAVRRETPVAEQA